MSRVSLVFGGCDYWDRSRPLIDQRVQPEGIELKYQVLDPIDLLRRAIGGNEFEASEMYACSYMILHARGDDRFVGLPIFPSRSFRHGYIFVRSDAGIERPQDLAGKRVGVGHYAITAAMWVRAFLQHDYGVPPSAIHWFEGGMWNPDDLSGHAGVDLPSEVRVSQAGHRTLEAMLLEGGLDALVSPYRPRAMVAGDPRVRRLFPNYPEVEKEYFRRSGFFPIMHLVVIRREVYEKHPWMANSLLVAFEEAKALARKRLEDTSALTVALPWLPAALEEVSGLFGGDAFPYGFEANLPILEAMTRYLVEQGMVRRKLNPKELFAPETLSVRPGPS